MVSRWSWKVHIRLEWLGGGKGSPEQKAIKRKLKATSESRRSLRENRRLLGENWSRRARIKTAERKWRLPRGNREPPRNCWRLQRSSRQAVEWVVYRRAPPFPHQGIAIFSTRKYCTNRWKESRCCHFVSWWNEPINQVLFPYTVTPKDVLVKWHRWRLLLWRDQWVMRHARLAYFESLYVSCPFLLGCKTWGVIVNCT